MKKTYTYPDAEVVIFASADNTNNLISNTTATVGTADTGALKKVSLNDLKK